MDGIPDQTSSDLAPYLSAVGGALAGIVELEPGDDPDEALFLLQQAAAFLGAPVVTGWLGHDRSLLAWRRWPEMPALGLRVLAAGGD